MQPCAVRTADKRTPQTDAVPVFFALENLRIYVLPDAAVLRAIFAKI